MPQSKAEKTALRSRLLQERRAYSKETISHHSKLVCKKLEEHWLWSPIGNEIKNIFAYLPINQELDLTLFLACSHDNGKTVFLPKTENTNMSFFEWDLQERSLESGRFKVPEIKNTEVAKTPSKNDLLLLPCLGVSSAGYRLGYGAGFYDRFLGSLGDQQPIKVAICFEHGFTDSVPIDDWDIPVHYVMTEKRLVQITP